MSSRSKICNKVTHETAQLYVKEQMDGGRNEIDDVNVIFLCDEVINAMVDVSFSFAL